MQQSIYSNKSDVMHDYGSIDCDILEHAKQYFHL